MYRQKLSEENLKLELEAHIATLEKKVKNLNFCVDHCTKEGQDSKQRFALVERQNADLKQELRSAKQAFKSI